MKKSVVWGDIFIKGNLSYIASSILLPPNHDLKFLFTEAIGTSDKTRGAYYNKTWR